MKVLVSFMVAAAGVVASGSALAQEQPEESVAMQANKGFRVGLSPVFLLPTDGGPLGGGLDVEGRYGFRVGPTVMAPGGRVAGYILSERGIGTAMPTFRVTIPAGPLAPFIVGGVGGGWISNPAESGVAWLGGGGLLVHLGRVLAVGADVTYQRITDTDFESIAIGPTIHFGS